MPKHSTKHADRFWRSLAEILRRDGASVEEHVGRGSKSLWVSGLSLSHADAFAFAEAIPAFARKHGLHWTARVSPEGSSLLLTFVASDR